MNKKDVITAVKENDHTFFFGFECEIDAQKAEEIIFNMFVDAIESEDVTNEYKSKIVSLFLFYGSSCFSEGREFMKMLKEKYTKF